MPSQAPWPRKEQQSQLTTEPVRELQNGLVNEIASAGGSAFAVKGDVSDEQAVESMFEETVSRCGRVDILVTNAGLQKDSSFREMSPADWRKVMDVNLTGQFLCARCRSPVHSAGRAPACVPRPRQNHLHVLCS
jgi:NAD(P)-dependent dehydrogenase (short-subunit alcohol dehydrogenase family)